MNHLILVRHGNTFEADEPPRWVGARTDLPLTQEGEAQGRAVAEKIAADFRPVSAIAAGPLQRTRRFAELIAKKASMGFSVDERLKEIDYGLWENKTGADIRAANGDALDAWEKEGLWPQEAGFSPPLAELKRNIQEFLSEQRRSLLTDDAKNRVAVTSNGVLRFVYAMVTGEKPSAGKVKTGAFCLLSPTRGGWRIESWNTRP